ncbi:MAG TPA: glycosyltransferase family 4 protein [Ktedonobacterales bacterium]|nr:glycosyltransferase family 4 protein [Ktedonobacterales bacterium]
MRIVVAHSRLNTLGGGERVTLELLRQLSRRHEVTLWAGGYDRTATYRELADFPRRDLAPWQWPISRADADVVIAQSFGASFLAVRHAATLCYVHTLRSIYLAGSNRPDLLARRVLDTLLLRRAGAVATNSEYTAGRLNARIGRQIEVIPCGVDPELFDLPEQPGTYALYVGRIAPEKGLERLLRWSAALPLDLMMVGTGPADYLGHLRRLAGPRVRWAGALRDHDLRRVYQDCRMFVFVPYEEEFGLAVLEAMAAGKPVVAAAEGGLPELVRAGTTGFLVTDQLEFERSVEWLAHDDVLCERMGRAARMSARRYSWDSMVRSIEATCERVARA